LKQSNAMTTSNIFYNNRFNSKWLEDFLLPNESAGDAPSFEPLACLLKYIAELS